MYCPAIVLKQTILNHSCVLVQGTTVKGFLFTSIIFLLIIWEFHTMYPNNIHFPVLLGPSPTLLTPPLKKEEKQRQQQQKRTNITKAICVAHIFSGAWSHSQWSEGFLRTFPSCRARDCTMLGKIPVLFGCVARGLRVCAAGLCCKGAQSSLSPPLPSPDFPCCLL